MLWSCRNGNFMTTPSPPSPPPSEALRRVVEALLEGQTPPPDAQAALSDTEKNEVAGLVRTAHLTRLSLHAAGNGSEGSNGSAEANALQKAQTALEQRPPITAPLPGDETLPWWERLWKRSRP